MSGLALWLTALALAMDCFSVSVASGIIMKRVQWRPMLVMAFLFGAFQALMPVLGWVCIHFFDHLVEQFDHWIAFAMLAFIGVKMILESFKQEEEQAFDPTNLYVAFTLAVATSIDAMAVGISFSCLGMNTVQSLTYPVWVIGLVSFVMSLAGLLLGIRFGAAICKKVRPELLGGIILIAIGTKILLEHLLAG